MKITRSLAVAALTFGSLFSFENALAADHSGKGMTISFDVGGPAGGAYSTILQNGATQACIDLGCDIRFVYSDWSPQKMIENFNRVVATRPDGIVVIGLPEEDSYEPAIQKARDKGILVTSTDTELPRLKKKYNASGFGYTGMDNHASGILLAKESIKRFKLKKGDKALVWGVKGSSDRGMSTIGMIDTLKEADMKVDYLEISAEVDRDPVLGLPLITAYLSRHPDTKLILVDHGGLTSQMENFLRAANKKPGQVHAAGFGLAPASIAAVESGYVELIGDGQAFLQGYLPVVQLVLSKRFGFSGLSINTGNNFITKDNIGLIAPLAAKGIR